MFTFLYKEKGNVKELLEVISIKWIKLDNKRSRYWN